jgi:hypothetical protein
MGITDTWLLAAVDDADAEALAEAVDATFDELDLGPHDGPWTPRCVELGLAAHEGRAWVAVRDPTGDVAGVLAEELADRTGRPAVVLALGGGADIGGDDGAAPGEGVSADDPEDEASGARVRMSASIYRLDAVPADDGGVIEQTLIGTASWTAEEELDDGWSDDELRGAFTLFAEELLLDAADELGLGVAGFPAELTPWSPR